MINKLKKGDYVTWWEDISHLVSYRGHGLVLMEMVGRVAFYVKGHDFVGVRDSIKDRAVTYIRAEMLTKITKKKHFLKVLELKS